MRHGVRESRALLEGDLPVSHAAFNPVAQGVNVVVFAGNTAPVPHEPCGNLSRPPFGFRRELTFPQTSEHVLPYRAGNLVGVEIGIDRLIPVPGNVAGDVKVHLRVLEQVLVDDHRRGDLVVLEVELAEKLLAFQIPGRGEPFDPLVLSITVDLYVIVLAEFKAFLLFPLGGAPWTFPG